MTTDVGANDTIDLVLRLALRSEAKLVFSYVGERDEESASARGIIKELPSVVIDPAWIAATTAASSSRIGFYNDDDDNDNDKAGVPTTPHPAPVLRTVTVPLSIQSLSVGSVIVIVNSSSPEVTSQCDLSAAFVEIHVEKSNSLHAICDIVGWTYMVSE